MSDIFTIVAQTPTGEPKYRWKAELIEKSDKLVIFYGRWLRLMQHADGHEALITNQSLEFYWADQLYCVSALYDQSGKIREYYGRVILPPQIDEHGKKITLTLIGPDLEISPSCQYEILDLPYQPTPEQEASFDLAQGWLDLVGLVERREGPFDARFIQPFLHKLKR